MFRKLSYTIAVLAACAFSTTALAQSDSPVTQASGSKISMASYGQAYSGGVSMQGPKAMAYGRTWGGAASSRDCSRFYHYPYVFYPQNFRGSEYYKSSDSLYYRYPAEMQIPVYNRHWHNYYPSKRRYHWGHQFILDVF